MEGVKLHANEIVCHAIVMHEPGVTETGKPVGPTPRLVHYDRGGS
jgi:hypothetical protein